MPPVSGGTRFLGGARKEDIAATLAHLAELQLEPVILHMFQGGRDTVVSADFCGHLTDYIAPDIAKFVNNKNAVPTTGASSGGIHPMRRDVIKPALANPF